MLCSAFATGFHHHLPFKYESDQRQHSPLFSMDQVIDQSLSLGVVEDHRLYFSVLNDESLKDRVAALADGAVLPADK
jgi:hypothetical protein